MSRSAPRRALVTGAGQGIGLAVARALAGEGHDVVLTDRHDGIGAIAEEIAATAAGTVTAVVADLRSPDDTAALAAAALAGGPVHVLVANAARCPVTPVRQPVAEAAAEHDATWAVNTRSVYALGRSLLGSLTDLVVMVSDHVHTEPGRPTGGGGVLDVYDASKWALVGLIETWRRALEGRVRVNGLCMGATDTPMIRAFMGPDVDPSYVARWADPADTARVVVDLLAEGPGGRTGTSTPLWIDHPVELPPPPGDGWVDRLGIAKAGVRDRVLPVPPPAGRSAVVTGAAQGLGVAYAEALAGAGAHLCLVDERPGVLAVAERIAAAYGVEAAAVVGDVSEADVVDEIVRKTARRGGADLLVNNAGRWFPTPIDLPVGEALDRFDATAAANVRGPLLLQRALTPAMIEGGGGDIVNVSTYYVLPPDVPKGGRGGGTNPVGTDAYNISKWALTGFTQAWARELAADGIRVNALAMGATDSPMLRGLFRPDEPPADVVAVWMRPEQQGRLLLDLLADGRSGEIIGSWVGRPVELPPVTPYGRPMGESVWSAWA